MKRRPLLELRGVRRVYASGENAWPALRDIDMVVHAGELVAVMGPSGSGKSTLLNILGCLDRPTSGSYYLAGLDTGTLHTDELAQLRRERFGFIFQRYNLLEDLSALGNVEVPAIYAGQDAHTRRARATALLSHLALAERLLHRPTQLSGGQQQRVSIARALMNGAHIILADEPTGALDTHAGEEVLAILKALHVEGHTIVIVTHDLRVAQHAGRIVEMSDGKVVSDYPVPSRAAQAERTEAAAALGQTTEKHHEAWTGRAVLEALRTALLAMGAHRLRTFLTMLGIVVGTASVIFVVALGTGGQQRVLSDIRGIGTNTLEIYPGADAGDENAGSIHTLVPADADALERLDYVEGVTPTVSALASVRVGAVSRAGSITGVGEHYFKVHGVKVLQGAPFTRDDTHDLAQVAVIDDVARQKLFAPGEHPLGQVILLGDMPVRIIGVSGTQYNPSGENQTLNVYVPYTTLIGRMLGPSSLRGITARIADRVSAARAAEAVTRLLIARHGRKDFFIFNADIIRRSVEAATDTLTLLVGSIAVVSLIVGGIGVMNIMLVSVAERTREIGIRTAVGARRRDILYQFLIEAILVCAIGGALGVVLALAAGLVYAHVSQRFPVIFSTASIVVALGVATIIGLAFGYFPARRAARLDPIQALAGE